MNYMSYQFLRVNLNRNIMKNIIAKSWIVLVMAALVSCAEKYPMYNLKDTRLGFRFKYDESAQMVLDSAIRFSFVYRPELVETTVWVEVQTSGFLSDNDRAFEVEQVEATAENVFTKLPAGTVVKNAESGVHFKSFDDPEIKKQMFVPAGSATAKFPIVFYRHPDMKTDKVYLRLKIKENSNFKESFRKNRYAVVEISDMLTKPATWDFANGFAGTYSRVKHEFMIKVATWTIDEAWFEDNFKSYETNDQGYVFYLSNYFTAELVKENDARLARGEDVIKDENGNPIFFTLGLEPQPYKSEN